MKRRLTPGRTQEAWRIEVERLKAECGQARRMKFWYEKGDQLSFKEGAFTFIWSEHFFEHLFPDEAFELFKDCHRMLCHGGVMRVSVPDADLRTYAPIEPPGINQDNIRPFESVPWTDPGKHKTRWNIYSLSLLLEQAGFVTVPIVYCDMHGNLSQQWPEDLSRHGEVADAEAVLGSDYIIRPLSLIVDAVKRDNATSGRSPGAE